MYLSLAILVGIIVLVVIVLIIWAAYAVSSSYQQTVTLTLPFEDTYRYIPLFNQDKKYSLNTIDIVVTGSIKNSGTIASGNQIKQVINQTIIEPYKKCLIMQEATILQVEETNLKRCPTVKSPTLENLSILFFNKLEPILRKVGAQLVSVQLTSDDIKVSHYRYKISNNKI